MTETLTERRRRLVREEIASVAIDLFLSHGYDTVTVDDIATAAGTSPRTVFRYFATKDEIVLDLMNRLIVRLAAALRSRPEAEGAVTAIRNAFLATSTVGTGDRRRAAQLGKILSRTPELQSRARGVRADSGDAILAWTAARMGLPIHDVRVRVLVTATTAVATAEFLRWAESGGHGEPSDAIASALELLEEGLAPLDQWRAGQTSDPDATVLAMESSEESTTRR